MPNMAEYYELAQYFEVNPDPNFAGCLNSHREEPGVVFPGIEPAEASYCFIGVSSLYEALASAHGLTPKKVKDLLSGADGEAGKVSALKAEIKILKERLQRFDDFIDAAEKAGLMVPAFE
jgi:hypothetical protein